MDDGRQGTPSENFVRAQDDTSSEGNSLFTYPSVLSELKEGILAPPASILISEPVLLISIDVPMGALCRVIGYHYLFFICVAFKLCYQHISLHSAPCHTI